MLDVIKLKKGFDINIVGEANKSIMSSADKVTSYLIKSTDFNYLTPKLLVKEGDSVKAGTPLFYDDNNNRIVITSPVSGIASKIKNSESIKEICISPTETIDYVNFDIPSLDTIKSEEVKEAMLTSGLWAFIRQRPFDSIANPDDIPKIILVSAFDTNPMAPDYDFIVHKQDKYFQTGIDILNKLNNSKIYLTVHQTRTFSNVFFNTKNVEIITFDGKHPSGNISVQIHHISPLSKNEVIWYVNPQDVITIGKFFTHGVYDATKIITIAGSEINCTGYHKIIAGASIESLVKDNIKENSNPRYISGNVLTGKQIEKNGYIGFYDNLVSVIPEGNTSEVLGWAKLGTQKYSFWHSFFSWMMPTKQYPLNTNYHGEKRALIFTEQFADVFPMTIMPAQLIKSCIVGDMEDMEDLGIYEVAPEDFAICEYIDPSKTEIQEIIKNALDKVRLIWISQH
ncbi:Na(+)-translocating NADH-quinone reductase subunit A [Bacteroidia bacterium]|nr:Na(+)-translocating NADH-quinone reductase subunit A [Bacteroidia bacterium]